jgi:nucleotide-binding universal stress UspA family protein
MTVVQHPIYREQEMASLRVEAERCLNRIKKQLSDEGMQVRAEVVFGRPAEMIVDYALSQGADLIAMATHGRGGFRRRFFGSVTEKVLRTTDLPILLITPSLTAEPAGEQDEESEQ